MFLARAPSGGHAELHPDEIEHALRVLRLVAGDHVLGVDGAGHAWRLRVAATERRRVVVDEAELTRTEAEPGSAASNEVRVTVYTALPRPGPAEEMLDRLTQLGATAIVPVVSARSGPHARELAPARRERLERIAREALKQSGRLWMPRLGEPIALADLVEHGFEVPTALLTPREPQEERVLRRGAEMLDWVLGLRASGAREVAVVVGPEGGFTEEEEERLLGAGARGCRLGRYVLRIETAAEAAVMLVALAGARAL